MIDPQTGKPLKRYYLENEKIIFYPLEVAYHPTFGVKLKIVTHSVAKKAFELKKRNVSSKNMETL
ncbi:hypothetical protein QUF70_19640 [Desulfobacterales bacterium HSG17]|nr:hypothetical protein [Desulfobacterales bacterium HSG17]